MSKKKTSPTFSTVPWRRINGFLKFFARIFLRQLVVKRQFNFPSRSTSVSTLPGENRTNKISLFYSMRHDCLINITCKNTFCSHFWHCGWHFIQLSIFQLPTVKLLEVLAHCDTCMLAHLTAAVSIMFCSWPIQALPVTSWRYKQS